MKKIYPNSWWRTNNRLDDTTLTAEAKYPINFTQSAKRFVIIYNTVYNILEAIVFYSLTQWKCISLKQKVQK